MNFRRFPCRSGYMVNGCGLEWQRKRKRHHRYTEWILRWRRAGRVRRVHRMYTIYANKPVAYSEQLFKRADNADHCRERARTPRRHTSSLLNAPGAARVVGPNRGYMKGFAGQTSWWDRIMPVRAFVSVHQLRRSTGWLAKLSNARMKRVGHARIYSWYVYSVFLTHGNFNSDSFRYYIL